MRPNVLLVVFDAARRDALEPYGARPGSSPAVADLARRGKSLERVYATAPWTVPSHASILTGLMPRAARLSRVGGSPERLAAARAAHRSRELPTVLGAAGYSTAALSANMWLSRINGFNESFDEFVQADTGRNAQIRAESMRARLAWYGEALRATADDGALRAEATVRSWAANVGERPFFWFVNLLECHSPYLPPRPYGGWAPLARIRAAKAARRHYTLSGIWRACAGVDRVSDDALATLRRFYEASIRYMDDWLARVLELLDSRGLLDDTLVIVLSDHGENLGEDGLIGHAMSLDNRLINVPFIAAGPGADAIELNSLVDLPRSLARICGVEDHPWTSTPPGGFGIAQFDPPVVAGEAENIERLRRAGIDGDALERFISPLTCAVRGTLKLVRRGPQEMLYDLAADPGETRPIPFAEIDTSRQVDARALRGALEFGSEPVDSESGPVATPAPSEADVRDLEERMKLLGYM